MHDSKFNISEVADLLGIERLTEGNSFGVVCPFCGDRRGKMNFRVLKNGTACNTYRCFNCGAQGNMLTLYAELKGIYGSDRFKVSYRKILEELRGGRTPLYPTHSHKKQKVERENPDQEVDFDKRDQIYRRLLLLLTLTEEHRANLLSRGFTTEQIETFGFRSTPLGGTESLARKLIKEGYQLSGVPGFYLNDHGNWDLAFYKRNHGILCPVYSIDGQITGFQIRLDHPYDGRKYLWFSSTNKLCGTGSRSPVMFLGNPYDPVIRVTEGILKAAAAHAMSGYSFIGIPGVGQYKELEALLMKLKDNGLCEVQEYYDMDKYMSVSCDGCYKESVCEVCQGISEWNEDGMCLRKLEKRKQIREGCKHLYETCEKLGLRCIQKRWDVDESGNWNGNLKGIDDYWHEKRIQARKELMIADEYNGMPDD